MGEIADSFRSMLLGAAIARIVAVIKFSICEKT